MPLAPAELRTENQPFVSRERGSGSMELIEIQLEGKKRMPASAFLNGFRLQPGEVLRDEPSWTGFRFAATFAGIRKVIKIDLALIVSDTPAAAAAVFTQNRVVAAPVELSRANLKKPRAEGRVRAILVNAGNANCATRSRRTGRSRNVARRG